MSQQLVPVNGGVLQVQTTTAQDRLNVLSQQYVQVKNLEERPTEWILEGRPIYRRLPSTSETYQIDFFNVVSAPNTAVAAEVQEIGYVYVPWDGAISGGESMEVVASDSNKALLIKGGNIVWKYGKTSVLPAIVDLEVLDVARGQYQVAYQLVYDDSPIPKLYSVSDFSLAGSPLNITSSSDSVVGWRYPAVNAFLNESVNWWANRDTYFPSGSTYSVQPTSSYLQWESSTAAAYSKVLLRCPPNTAYVGSASLSYVSQSTLVNVSSTDIQSDRSGQFFEFLVQSPVFQTGWNVTFSSLDMAVQSIEVSGIVTRLEPQAAPSTRAVLVMYPSDTFPKTTTNSQGVLVPATYCPLAKVDTTNDYSVYSIRDERYIIHRDYTPVADWLTKPFDDDLINLYEQVSDYSNLWLAPSSCMRQEYLTLTDDQIVIV
jgi:hypothetical protein